MKHRTAQGKMIDMNTLMLQNEKAKAVGNVRVNARGDHIDSSGKIITKKEDLMKQYYKVNEKQPPNTLEQDEDK